MALFGTVNKPFEQSHAGVIAHEQLHAAGVANHVRLALLGLPNIKSTGAQGAGEQPLLGAFN
jgi:hypothetical protein